MDRTKNIGKTTTSQFGTSGVVKLITAPITDPSQIEQAQLISMPSVSGLNDVHQMQLGGRFARIEYWESQNAADQGQRSGQYQSGQQKLQQIFGQKLTTETGSLLTPTFK